MADKVKITLAKSPIGSRKDQRQTLLGLGLKRLGKTVELEKTPAVMGMINKVGHLLQVEGD